MKEDKKRSKRERKKKKRGETGTHEREIAPVVVAESMWRRSARK